MKNKMTAADWLAERARIEQAATEGPWENDGGGEINQHFSLPEPWATVVSTDVACMAYCYGGSAAGVERDEDAEFIADARTSAPRMRAALEAVLALHETVAVYAQADECECGNEDHTIIESGQGDDLCWDTPTGELCCPECLDEDSGAIDYPCPTVAEIAKALGVES